MTTLPDFDTRMKARINDLIDNPDSLTPDYSERYRILLEHCEGLTAHSAYAMTLLLGKDSSRGYHELPQHPVFEFPAVHLPDLECQVGWHFFVGTATGTDGLHYGIQFMLWTYSLLPAPVRDALGISAIDNQVMEVHVAISREGDRHYRGAPVVLAGSQDGISIGSNPFEYRAGPSSAISLQPDALVPMRVTGLAVDRSADAPIEVAIDLTFTEAKAPILQGKDGAAPSIGGVGTLYYSVPRLALATTGSSLRIGDVTVELTGGEFWFDHQWGTGFLPSGNPRDEAVRAFADLPKPGPGGWDWFMAHFDGDLQLTCAAIHTNADRADYYDQSGDEPPKDMTVTVEGKWVDAAGIAYEATGSLTVDRWVKAERSPDPSLYPISHVWYPDRWNFTMDEALPAIMHTFTMDPIVTGGQVGYFAPGMQYAEGAVTLTGPDGSVGRGFAESVAYVTKSDAIFSLAGVANEPRLAQLMDEPVGLGLKVRAIGHLAHPSALRALAGWLK
jgi:predicted secreted hydrolase